jgi:superfamily II RNA helicase
MVIVTSNSYAENSEYEVFFKLFKYDLSPFQKDAIRSIVDGNHCLVTAPTGSGKTIPGEFAIQHFVKQGKKVIYTSPIKALSNQKFYEFAKKYPEITFGLLTGDIKINTQADVLIMTTEVLMNKLFIMSSSTASSLTFEMDIQTELGCVVHDEVHYINDAHRGHVWEQCILMLPPQVQMVMLSATLDNPSKFAKWIESKHTEKQVVICSTNTRIVPLTHYVYVSSPEGLFKKMKDKDTEQLVRKSLNRCLTIRSAEGVFSTDTYNETKRILALMEKHDVHQQRRTVLNDLLLHLRDHDMLPAICFVFSRKLVEQCAEEVSVRVLEDDSKVPYTIERECEAIIRRLPNWREYAGLPEYRTLVKLLEKGVGIHHSGMIPVLREIVEFMISKKYIRILFATESFAIGLDCPIKTAIFISLKKHDGGEQPRYLLSHEYTQMAGRAGRRGIDTVGHVIHCGNLFEQPDINTYKEILCGKPQKLVSKFQIYYPVVLNLFKTSKQVLVEEIEAFVNHSMYKSELDCIQNGLLREYEEIDEKVSAKHHGFADLKTPRDTMELYDSLIEKSQFCANKKRKEIDAQIKELKMANPHLEKDFTYYRDYVRLIDTMKQKESSINGNANSIKNEVANLLYVMEEFKIIERGDGASAYPNAYRLTQDRGMIASSIAETNPVLMALICTEWKYFEEFTPPELAAFFSIFTDARTNDDWCENEMLSDKIKSFNQIRYWLWDAQEARKIYVNETGLENFCYGLVDVILKWCKCENETECKMLIAEYELSIGDFTKAVLKISTLSREMIGMCEQINNIELMSKLAAIDGLILKYVTTNQSLYL